MKFYLQLIVFLLPIFAAVDVTGAQEGLADTVNKNADNGRELERLMMVLRTSPRKNLEQHLKALADLSLTRDVVSELMTMYLKLPSEDFGSRAFVLSILGEFQDQRTFSLLHNTVWQPLELRPQSSHLDPAYTGQELLQGKAVHGIGYLRSRQAQHALLDVTNKHPSMYVRVEAVAAYIWNSKDKKKARRVLRDQTPDSLHSYIGMPRFHRVRDEAVFNADLAQWRATWRPSIQ